MSKVTERADELFKLGLKMSGMSYVNLDKGIIVAFLDISTYSDEQWNELITEIKERNDG